MIDACRSRRQGGAVAELVGTILTQSDVLFTFEKIKLYAK